jgi:hypothetical protein
MQETAVTRNLSSGVSSSQELGLGQTLLLPKGECGWGSPSLAIGTRGRARGDLDFLNHKKMTQLN